MSPRTRFAGVVVSDNLTPLYNKRDTKLYDRAYSKRSPTLSLWRKLVMTEENDTMCHHEKRKAACPELASGWQSWTVNTVVNYNPP